MKVFEGKLVIPFTWTFSGDGQVLRSTVVGGYQAEIHKSRLRISSRHGYEVYSGYCKSRENGMRTAEKVLTTIVGEM